LQNILEIDLEHASIDPVGSRRNYCYLGPALAAFGQEFAGVLERVAIHLLGEDAASRERLAVARVHDANLVFRNRSELLDVDFVRAHLEEQLWPQGPFCPHCGSFAATKLEGKAHRPGLYQCNDCREQYTVTVGTVFERSKIGLHKWVLASHLIGASKKGMS